MSRSKITKYLPFVNIILTTWLLLMLFSDKYYYITLYIEIINIIVIAADQETLASFSRRRSFSETVEKRFPTLMETLRQIISDPWKERNITYFLTVCVINAMYSFIIKNGYFWYEFAILFVFSIINMATGYIRK